MCRHIKCPKVTWWRHLLDLHNSLFLVSLQVSLSKLLAKLTLAHQMLLCDVLAVPVLWWKLPGVWNKKFGAERNHRDCGVHWHQQSTSGCSHFVPKLSGEKSRIPQPSAKPSSAEIWEKRCKPPNNWFLASLRRFLRFALLYPHHPCISLLYSHVEDWGVQDFHQNLC